MSWRNIIDDAREAIEEIGENIENEIENLGENIENEIENLGESLQEIDVQDLLNSDTFRRISALVVGGNYILGYSLLNYIVTEAANNSETSNTTGWTLDGNTFKAIGEQIDNLLLINQNNSTATNIDASNVINNLILVGNTLSNVITGGNGSSIFWGGGEGNNTLTGGTSRDQFWYLGGSNDIVTNFLTGTADNSDVAVFFGNLVNVSRSGDTVSINFAGGHSLELKTNSASSDDVLMCSFDGDNIFGAKIADNSATNLTYDSSADYFQLSESGTLNLTDADNNNIFLDNSQGKFFINVANIDASSSTGENILVGDSNSNSITGGAGITNLWGGVGNVSDSLIGGSGSDTFWFGKNDGSDFITNASSSDIVNLYDVSINDITSLSTSDNQITIGLNTFKNHLARRQRKFQSLNQTVESCLNKIQFLTMLLVVL